MSETPANETKAARAVRRMGVVVVDPFPVVRAGLASTIEASPGLEVLAQASSADEAIAVVANVRRSRVVVLVAMGLAGDKDSYWLIRTLRERFPGHAILGLGANADPHVVSRALFVGADGFVDKNIELDEFLAAIQQRGERGDGDRRPGRRLRRARSPRGSSVGGASASGSRGASGRFWRSRPRA